jgi:hypothetical protein
MVAIGTTTMVCRATDLAGNSATTARFSLHIAKHGRTLLLQFRELRRHRG